MTTPLALSPEVHFGGHAFEYETIKKYTYAAWISLLTFCTSTSLLCAYDGYSAAFYCDIHRYAGSALQTLPDLTQPESVRPLRARGGTLVTVAQEIRGIAVPGKKTLPWNNSDLYAFEWQCRRFRAA